MSLPHAILGFLASCSMTGYDLKTQSFDKSVSYFWPADQAQIYRTLDRLEEEKWVESHIEFQLVRPNRKLYRITQNGLEELRRWLHIPQPLPIHRDPFLVQMYFGEELDNHALLLLLENQKAAHAKLLSVYNCISFTLIEQQTESRGVILSASPLKLGIRIEEAYVEWLDEMIHTIQQMEDKTNP